MTARWAFATVLAVGGIVTACNSSTPGTPVTSPRSPTEPSSPTVAAPGAEVLPPENGYVFIETKSGKTRCQLNEEEVGCEAQFTNSPVLDGSHANGVRLTANGEITWLVGNLGDIPVVTLDYRTYSAVGWTINAGEDGTRFTNDRTGHGMTVSVDGVQAF
jgi:hypothetical protein